MAVVGDPGGSWLERLTLVTDIDPGEAILFAVAASRGLPIISGDVRALRALREVEGFQEALAERIVVVEAVLLSLCRRLGADNVRERIAPIRDVDTVLRVCFSPENRAPEEALLSYFQERTRELAPLMLWRLEEQP